MVLLVCLSYTVAVVALVLGIGYVQRHSTNSTLNTIKQNAVTSCLGSGGSRTRQLDIDWAIYQADVQSARSSLSTPSQQKIRGREAATLYKDMRGIAAVRIDVSLANTLPPPLAAIVTQAGFRCSEPNLH